jgi:hypothetical protein
MSLLGLPGETLAGNWDCRNLELKYQGIFGTYHNKYIHYYYHSNYYFLSLLCKLPETNYVTRVYIVVPIL